MKKWILSGSILAFAAGVAFAAGTNESKTNDVKAAAVAAPRKAPAISQQQFKEIRGILEKKYVDPKEVASEKLDALATESVVEAFGDSIQVLSPSEAKKEGQDLRPVIAAKAVIQPFIGYIRLNRFDTKAPESIWQIVDEMEKKDHISGLILDLRYLNSDDYVSAVKLASLFLPDDVEIFRWEKTGGEATPVKSVGIKDRVTLPVAILVNQDTAGAAEVLAAVLKERGKAVIVGRAPSAGKAYKTTDQPLSDGKILRFATERVKLAKGGYLFQKGVVPDVKPEFAIQSEKEVFEKPFEPPVEFAETPLFNEAILTGKSSSPLPANLEKERKGRVMPASNNDVTLQRAIDLLKGLRALALS